MLAWASLAPRLPSICISYAVLIAPLERSTCTNQRSLLSLKMRSRSSSSSFASNSLDLTVATASGLILQICLIMALSLHCKRYRFVLVSGQVSLAWSMALRTQELYTCVHWLESKAKNLSTCSLNCLISYIHTKKKTSPFQKSNLKILCAQSLTKTHYCHGSHLGYLGETPIEFDRERLGSVRKCLMLALLNRPQI